MTKTLNVTDDDRASLRKLERIMSHVRTTIDPNVPAQLVQTFLTVALHEGMSLSDFANTLGSNLSTVSRHLLDLGERNRKMEPGHDLVARRANPMNLRENHYTLTPKGKLLIRQLVEIVES